MNRFDPWKSIRSAISQPTAYWKLKIDGTGIQEAELLEAIYLYLFSFLGLFKDHHQFRLRQAFHKSLSQVLSIYRSHWNEDQKILMQKLLRIHLDDAIWFKNEFLLKFHFSERNWSYVQKENQEPSLIRPFKRKNRYANFSGESYFKHFLKGIQCLFFPTLFTSPFRKCRDELMDQIPPKSESDDLNIQWIGHSCCLIQIAGTNILTDPSFGDIMPLFKRYTEPGVALKNLPRIDQILISHNHSDHFEEEALEYLRHFQPAIFIPKGMKSWFLERGFQKVYEHDWWTETTAFFKKDFTSLPTSVKITSVPAFHWSQRGILDGNRSLWTGWMIEANNQKIYFAGDTAYNAETLHQIKNQFGQIDVALLPIAPEGEENVHMNHIEALDALHIIDPHKMVPIHWGAFRTGKEKMEDPIHFLFQELEKREHLKAAVSYLKVGQYLTVTPLEAAKEDLHTLIEPAYK